MNEAADVKGTVEKFITDNFLIGASRRPLDPDDSFLEKSIIDSTGILELVGFIEKSFGFKMQDEELIPDNLDSINRVVSFIERRKKP